MSEVGEAGRGWKRDVIKSMLFSLVQCLSSNSVSDFPSLSSLLCVVRAYHSSRSSGKRYQGLAPRSSVGESKSSSGSSQHSRHLLTSALLVPYLEDGRQWRIECPLAWGSRVWALQVEDGIQAGCRDGGFEEGGGLLKK